uniref:Uncharacterized protein n=1 Tax=Rhizophora mucronata TaxID=61149 RepID=A0A2P2ILG1_RHIMU
MFLSCTYLQNGRLLRMKGRLVYHCNSLNLDHMLVVLEFRSGKGMQKLGTLQLFD